MRGYSVAIVVSVVLHALLVWFVFNGIQSAPSQPLKAKAPRYIEAKLVQLKAAAPVKKAPKVKPKKKVVDLAKKRREQERLKKKQAEQKRKKIAAKKALDKKKKAEQAKRKKEQLARAAKEEALRQQQAEEQFQQELDDALQEEETLLAAESLAEMAQSYSALIAQRIHEVWSRPPSARNGMKCELQLNLVPSGEVVDVSVIKSSGNGAFDRSAEQAVRRVGRFEELKGMPIQVFEKNFRQFTLEFNPQDLRL